MASLNLLLYEMRQHITPRQSVQIGSVIDPVTARRVAVSGLMKAHLNGFCRDQFGSLGQNLLSGHGLRTSAPRVRNNCKVE
jgi:hypothetical protein